MSRSIEGRETLANVLHYQFSAVRNKTFIILYFVGKDLSYALSLAKSVFQNGEQGNCIISGQRVVIFSKEFRLDQNIIHTDQYEENSMSTFMNVLFEQTHDHNSSPVNILDILDADFRISVAVKTSKIRADMQVAVKQSIQLLLSSDMRFVESNLHEGNISSYIDTRLESYEDVLTPRFYHTISEQTVPEKEITDVLFTHLSERLFSSAIDWSNADELEFSWLHEPAEERENHYCYSDEPSLTFSTFSVDTQQPPFSELSDSFVYRYRGKNQEVTKSIWGGLRDWDLYALSDVALQCKFSRLRGSGGMHLQRFEREQVTSALDVVSAEGWEAFIRKCILTLEREDIKYKLVITGPAAIANSVAASISMILPSFTRRFIAYQPVGPHLPVCGDNASNRSSISGVSEYIEQQPFRCQNCGRFRHQLRPLAGFIQIIGAPIRCVSREILYDLLIEKWAVADLCTQKVYYLPRLHQKRHFMEYIREIDIESRQQQIIPAKGNLEVYFEHRRQALMAEQQLAEALAMRRRNYALHILTRKGGVWLKFM